MPSNWENISKDALFRLMMDPRFYLENFCKLITKDEGIKPFVLNNAQLDFFNNIAIYDRIVILKARQLGLSTAVAGFFYHYCITHEGVNAAIISYDRDQAEELLAKVKFFWETTPEALRPQVLYNSKHEMSFPKLHSKITVLPATERVGRGWCLQLCHCSELAFWDDPEEKLTNLEAATEKGRLVVESTPANLGDRFHRLWLEDNGYTKLEYGWWWGYDEERLERLRKRINDPQRFAREYLLEFMSSGRPVFDPRKILEMRKQIKVPGDEIELADGKKGIVRQQDDGLVIYKEPEEGGIYAMGVDVSEGIQGGDFSVVTIFNRKTGEEVAFFRGLIAPDVLGEKVNEWGRFFKNALCTTEINNHGLTTLTILKQKMYPSLYFRPAEFEKMGSPFSEKLGWKTTILTRPLMIDDLVTHFREGTLTIHSKATLDEALCFAYDRTNKAIAPPGFHDDCIFSCAIAVQGFKILYGQKLEQLDIDKHWGHEGY